MTKEFDSKVYGKVKLRNAWNDSEVGSGIDEIVEVYFEGELIDEVEGYWNIDEIDDIDEFIDSNVQV